MKVFYHHNLKYLSALVLLSVCLLLAGCRDFEAISTMPDGRILLLREIERDDWPDQQFLYRCQDLKGNSPELYCDSALQL